MKVFISWSGEKSKETAIILKSWIRMVIQNADTWISTEIDKGEKWNHELSEQLKNTKVGIICINRENLDSNWILFEAGALSKTEDAKVCTFLLDLKPTDVKFPLAQFQSTVFSKEDIKQLVKSINDKLIEEKERHIPINELDEIFETFYPKLENQLNEIKDKKTDDGQQRRTDRELLEEMLNLSRNLSRIEGRNVDSEEISLRIKEITHRMDDSFQESKYMSREMIDRMKQMFKENEFLTQKMYDIVEKFDRTAQELNKKISTDYYESKDDPILDMIKNGEEIFLTAFSEIDSFTRNISDFTIGDKLECRISNDEINRVGILVLFDKNDRSVGMIPNQSNLKYSEFVEALTKAVGSSSFMSEIIQIGKGSMRNTKRHYFKIRVEK